MTRHLLTSAASAALLLLGSGAAHALTFNFTFTASTNTQQQQAFIDAGARSGVLASTGSRRTTHSYSNYLGALSGDRSSASDFTAVGSLPTGSSFGVLINRTLDNPNGAGSATPYVDNVGANNSTVNLTTANAKALGLNPGTGTVGVCTSTCDASIRFGTAFTWDYNPNDGISAGAYDFVGIAAHEIGHALGFISGVDVLDINSTNSFFNADQFTFVNSLDLYRFSPLSLASGVRDFTADSRAKTLSIDGGATQVALVSLGRTWGDGQQASHWKDSLGLGIMDPTAGQGELLLIRPNDVLAFDVIGWNLAAVPEPETYALFALGLVAIGWRLRAQRES
jgi:hypothetical protein